MRFSSRLAALAFACITACLPLTSCTSSADDLVRSVQEQQAGSSWYGGQEEGVAVFLQWVRVGNNLTGSIEGVTRSDGQNLKTTRQFTGVLSGQNFVLNFTDDQASTTSATGNLAGGDVIINTPEPNGSLTPELLKAGTVADFNKLVDQLSASPATGTYPTSTLITPQDAGSRATQLYVYSDGQYLAVRVSITITGATATGHATVYRCSLVYSPNCSEIDSDFSGTISDGALHIGKPDIPQPGSLYSAIHLGSVITVQIVLNANAIEYHDVPLMGSPNQYDEAKRLVTQQYSR